MRRQMDLIKAILKYIECNGSIHVFIDPPEIPGFDDDQIRYHLSLCVQAGYITHRETMAGIFPGVLTWDGHQVLDALRSSCQ